MKSNNIFKITAKVQGIYFICIILNFLCIWMFTIGVPYTFPFAILGNVFILLLPVELVCLIINLISIIIDIIVSSKKRQAFIRLILSGCIFALLCAIKILLYYYGDVLLLVV